MSTPPPPDSTSPEPPAPTPEALPPAPTLVPSPQPDTPSPPPPDTTAPVTPSPPPPDTTAPVTPSPPPPDTTAPVTPSPPPPVTTPTPSADSPPPPVVNPPPPLDGVTASPPPPDGVTTSPPPPDNSTLPPTNLLSPPPPAPSNASPSNYSSSPSSSNSTAVGVGVAVVAVVMLGLVAGLIYFCVRKRHRRRQPPPAPTPPAGFYDAWMPMAPQQQSHAPSPSATSSPTPPLLHSWQSSTAPSEPLAPQPFHPSAFTGGTFAYDDLAAATDGFSDANLLGQGGFGLVYRGTLRGKEVAIKKLRAGSGQGDREFRAEVDIISRVHHKNLVSLAGYCIHGEQRLLVYEFVSNKTLEFHLHGSGRVTLDWPRRWKIALGSAKGLAYLHEDCHPNIIHRDIKAANILLDYNYEPKVADFGLAKYQAGDNTHVSTRVMGTFGYLAPEYATTGKVNDRSDVFSFGVMLLELITGRRPVMTSASHQDEYLVAWAKPLLIKAIKEDNLEGVIDPSLETNYDACDMSRLIACAAAAVRHTARSRPRMSQIVRYLEGELSINDLNAGVAPGQSAMQGSGGTTEHIQRLRRMAFGTGTGTITEYTSSDFSEPTSEYGQNPSSEYTSSTGDASEMEMQRARRQYTDFEALEAATERMSRRTSRSGRAGRGLH